MSIILDALRRADSDREGRSSPAASVRVPGLRRNRGTRWGVPAAILVVVNAGLLALWWTRAPEAVPAPAQTISAPPSGRIVSAPPARSAVTAAAGATDEAVPAPQPAAPAPAVATVPMSDATGAPLLGELPLAFRATIPEHTLDVHVYAEVPADRFVMLNLERLGEGRTSRDGITVVEVLPDGVILRWRGQDFLEPR